MVCELQALLPCGFDKKQNVTWKCWSVFLKKKKKSNLCQAGQAFPEWEEEVRMGRMHGWIVHLALSLDPEVNSYMEKTS